MFGVEVPTDLPGRAGGLLDPRSTWADGEAYDRQAAALARMFAENFWRYADGVAEDVRGRRPGRQRLDARRPAPIVRIRARADRARPPERGAGDSAATKTAITASQPEDDAGRRQQDA